MQSTSYYKHLIPIRNSKQDCIVCAQPPSGFHKPELWCIQSKLGSQKQWLVPLFLKRCTSKNSEFHKHGLWCSQVYFCYRDLVPFRESSSSTRTILFHLQRPTRFGTQSQKHPCSEPTASCMPQKLLSKLWSATRMPPVAVLIVGLVWTKGFLNIPEWL